MMILRLKMIKKQFKIEIYQTIVTIILDKDLSYVEKKYKTKSLKDYSAVTLKYENKYRNYVVAFTDKDHLSNIAHEIVHLINYIYLDFGIELDRVNDENQAYLSGYLFDKIYNILNKK